LDIDLNLAIAAIVNFVILAVALRFFLYKPVTKMLDSRKEEITTSLEAAAAAREEVAQTQDIIRADLAKARQEAENIILTAEKSGTELKEQIVTAAEAEASSLVERAKEEIASQRDDAIAELRKELAVMAVAAAAKIIHAEMDEKLQKELMAKYIQEMGQS